MKTTNLFFLPSLALLALLLTLSTRSARAAETRIPLTPEMLINEAALGNTEALVDEQNAIGDPGSGKGIRPEKPFFPGWSAWQYPLSVIVDLGAEHRLTKLCLFNETGETKITIGTGKPFAWKETPTALNGYREWKTFPLETTTRFVRLTLTQPTSLPELALYGERIGKTPDTPAGRPVKKPVPPTMDQFIGTNAFIDDPIDKLTASVGFVREYHNWGWDREAKDKQLRFQPSGAAGGNSWFFDDYYSKLKAGGVTVCPDIQQSTSALFPGDNLDAKPIAAGADSEDPASYRLHAQHLFQYAARYGSKKVPDSRLDLAPGQPRVSGLNLLRYIENWNEPDKTWRGREGRFTPFELAAMSSGDYEAIHDADPTLKMVMGGLAGLDLEYLRSMKFWSDGKRGPNAFPADVLNLHHYSSDGNEQGFKTQGISPEADQLREKMARIVSWRNANVPGAEVWLTEFGYDTHPKSPLHAPAIGSYSAEDTQAIWLIRSYLALAAAGVDRAAMFMFRDTGGSNEPGVFATCGMVTQKGEWKPKPSYFYIATLKNRLRGMRFVGDVVLKDKSVTAYRFSDGKDRSAILVWSPTSEDNRIPNVEIPVGAGAVTRVDFENGTLDGKATPASPTNGSLRIEVREKPTLLLLTGSKTK
jgi:hypothetical protein